MNTNKQVARLRVSDVMHKDVVVLKENQTLSQAVCILEKFGVSGAPVVDRSGVCVGVLSASDFLARERQLNDRHHCFGVGLDGIFLQRAPVYVESIEDNLVREHMCRDIQSINKDAPLVDAARIMKMHHIHRLLILDDQQYPVGIISALDFVTLIVDEFDESFESGTNHLDRSSAAQNRTIHR